MIAIEAKKVTKWFKEGKKKHIAIANLNLEVKPNQIFGLLGANGAGKTTLLSIFATTLLPSEGTVTIFGKDIIKDKLEIRRMISTCSGYSGLFDDLTVLENMIYYAKMRRIPDEKKRIEDALKLVDMIKNQKIVARDLSTGMRQRISLAISLLSRPKLLLLDEPTAGLDPKIASRIRKGIKKFQEKTKMTIILTTHNMYEAEELCDNIALLKKGKLLTVQTVEGLRKTLGGYQIIEVETEKPIKKIKSKGVKSMTCEDKKAIIRIVDVERNLMPLMAKLKKYKVKKIGVRELTLEELYIAYM